MTACQKDAKAGLYARAMAAFICWIAPRRDEVLEELEQEKERLRDGYKSWCQHPRTASIAADLHAGFETFLEFAEEQEAISWEEYKVLLKKAADALESLLKDQDQHQKDATPVEQFLSLLRSSILTGDAFLADTSGGVPTENPTDWGWKEESIWVAKETCETRKGREEGDEEEDNEEDGEWKKKHIAKGKTIGWINEPFVYLEPGASLAMAQELARKQGTFLNLSDRTLGRALQSEHKLESTELARGKYTIRKHIQGHRHNVLCMLASTLFPNGFEEFAELIA